MIAWPWLALAGLGAFHGLNPAMGWLFAVALGLHRRDRRVVWLSLLPPVLQGFKAVAPLVTDIDLSMDDRFLYVSCWGTGDMIQYDVSDPFNPKETGRVRIGGIVSRASHPGARNGALNGGPQMVEISRDGKRVYFTNSLYGAIDPQFYPDGIDGWMVKLDVAENGGISFDEKFFIDWPKGHRPHQVRLEGGDCSSDSYCYP